MIKKFFLICSICGKEFISNRRKKYCKLCSAEKVRKNGSKSSKKRMIRNRNFIKDYKKDNKCEICGYNKYPELLVFHHKNKKEKNQNINILMKTLKNMEIIKKEIRKCILLCPNCHAEVHLNERRTNKI